MNGREAFLRARDFLVQHRDDHATACRDFRWPVLDTFNWALDYFDAYAAAQECVSAQWQEPADWTRKAVLNVARMGKFSSDRTIREYARAIWGLTPVPPGDAAR